LPSLSSNTTIAKWNRPDESREFGWRDFDCRRIDRREIDRRDFAHRDFTRREVGWGEIDPSKPSVESPQALDWRPLIPLLLPVLA
jgi:hypothetical protein